MSLILRMLQSYHWFKGLRIWWTEILNDIGPWKTTTSRGRTSVYLFCWIHSFTSSRWKTNFEGYTCSFLWLWKTVYRSNNLPLDSSCVSKCQLSAGLDKLISRGQKTENWPGVNPTDYKWWPAMWIPGAVKFAHMYLSEKLSRNICSQVRISRNQPVSWHSMHTLVNAVWMPVGIHHRCQCLYHPNRSCLNWLTGMQNNAVLLHLSYCLEGAFLLALPQLPLFWNTGSLSTSIIVNSTATPPPLLQYHAISPWSIDWSTFELTVPRCDESMCK